MNMESFIAAFDRASAACRENAQGYVGEMLPASLRFDFVAARRPVDRGGQIKFLGGRLLASGELWGVEPVRARRYLWVDGRIPVWIDLAVHAADDRHTYLLLACSSHVTADDRCLYHQHRGNPPFNVRGPALPAGWISVEASGRFGLGGRELGSP